MEMAPRVGSIVLAAGLLAAAAFGVYASPGPHAAGNLHGPAQGSPCVVTHGKVAAPSAVLLGESIEITLTASFSCAAATSLHVVLVLDTSTSMRGARSRSVITASQELIKRLDLPNNPMTTVGVVEFNESAWTVCQLTNDEGRALSCATLRDQAGGSRIDLGIMEGIKLLRRGRNRESDRDNLREVLVVLADGPNDTGCPPQLQAAGSAKSQGILLITVALGPNADYACMERTATRAPYAFMAGHHDDLSAVFGRVYLAIARVSAPRLTITDGLPANMRYITGTTDATWKPGLRQLEWTTMFVSRDGVTHTYRVEPLELGRWPLNVEAVGNFLDNLGATGRFTFAVPEVVVLNPGTVATPSATAPPAATPTASPIPSVTPSPKPRDRQCFLPYVRLSRAQP